MNFYAQRFGKLLCLSSAKTVTKR